MALSFITLISGSCHPIHRHTAQRLTSWIMFEYYDAVRLKLPPQNWTRISSAATSNKMVVINYEYCDDNALPASSTKASTLIPNRFYKLCPGVRVTSGSYGNKKYASLGQPRCGDGSNFSFFVSHPLQRLENERKILIEFQGGGACWDNETCGMQQEMLAIPEYFDNFVGMSCSEIEYGMSLSDDTPLSMLCSKSIDKTDFREYTTIVVRYCTQDIHLGDNPNVSYNNGETYVHHVGAHNLCTCSKFVLCLLLKTVTRLNFGIIVHSSNFGMGLWKLSQSNKYFFDRLLRWRNSSSDCLRFIEQTLQYFLER